MKFNFLLNLRALRGSFLRGISLLLIVAVSIVGSLAVVVAPAEATPVINASALPSAQVNITYNAQLTASGTPTFSNWIVVAGSLPPGLGLNAATGVINGIPFNIGTFNFSVTVTDSSGPPPTNTSAAQGFFITVMAPALEFINQTLPTATEGSSYSANINVRGGITPYTFGFLTGILPAGLNFDSFGGNISGTPDRGTAGTYTISVTVSDSSTPRQTAQQSFTLIIRKGFWETVVTISAGLTAGETNVYVDGRQVARVRGGQTTRFSSAVGATPEVSVDSLVTNPIKADVRFKVDVEKITVNEQNPNASFSYTAEYFVDPKTDPPSIANLSGANWYREGAAVRASAQSQVDGTAGTQYRFAYWQLPTGERIRGEDLSWQVTQGGRIVATYDTYHLLTVNSTYGRVDGAGYQKAGNAVKWSVTPAEVPMTGLMGFFRGKLVPDNINGTEVMDGPKTVNVNWEPDYTVPTVLISLLVIVLIGATLGIYRLFNPPAPRPAMAPPPPYQPSPPPPQMPMPQPQPTIVVLEQPSKPQAALGGGTRDQLLEQFSQLLQKYESEVTTHVKPDALSPSPPPPPAPAPLPMPETQRLAAPKGPIPFCEYTTRNLVRTVASNWRKLEERVAPPRTEEAAEKGLSIVTVWARDIYNEWEIFTCALPRGHIGKHDGNTEYAYTLQSTVKEERGYSGRQKIAPPKPHFTDELPVVDVARNQILSDSPGSDQPRSPDEVIPPE